MSLVNYLLVGTLKIEAWAGGRGKTEGQRGGRVKDIVSLGMVQAKRSHREEVIITDVYEWLY